MPYNVPRHTGLAAYPALERARASAMAGAARRAAHALERHGQHGDRHLVHVNDHELAVIRSAFGPGGHAGRRNPVTGLESFAPEEEESSPEEAPPDAGFAGSNPDGSGYTIRLPAARAAFQVLTGIKPDAGAQPEAGEPSAGVVAWQAFLRGLRANYQDVTGRSALPPDATDPMARYIDEPYDFSPGIPNFKKILGKTVYGLTESAPEAVGAVGGALAGTAVSPETPGLSQAVGAGVGAAAVHAAKVLGPLYAAELQQTPDDGDGAFARAVAKAGQDSLFTGASFALFGAKPFAGAVKNLLFQTSAVQPGVAVAKQATENLEQGRPITQGLGQAYGEGAAGTAVPLVADRAIRTLTNAPGDRVSTDVREGETAEQPAQTAAEEATDESANALQLDPRFFIRAPTGRFEFGEIPPDVASQIGRESGPILLPRGDANYGSVHISQFRLPQLKRLGFSDTPDYVHHVTSGYSQIYAGDRGRLLLARKNGMNHLAVVELNPVENGAGWTVISAHPQRDTRAIKGRLIWDAARSTASPASGEPVRFADPTEASPDQQDFRTTDQTD